MFLNDISIHEPYVNQNPAILSIVLIFSALSVGQRYSPASWACFLSFNDSENFSEKVINYFSNVLLNSTLCSIYVDLPSLVKI